MLNLNQRCQEASIEITKSYIKSTMFIMAWHDIHIFKYSEDERRKKQNPENFLKSLGLKTGMNFVDSGCNDGFFTVPAAKIVGESGKVLAIDTDEKAIAKLNQKLIDNNISNTTLMMGRAEDIIAFKNKADIILFAMVLHDFEDPVNVLKNSKCMLKKNGHIYDYDWRKNESNIGPPSTIRLSEARVAELVNEADLKIHSFKNINDDFYLIDIGHQVAV